MHTRHQSFKILLPAERHVQIAARGRHDLVPESVALGGSFAAAFHGNPGLSILYALLVAKRPLTGLQLPVSFPPLNCDLHVAVGSNQIGFEIVYIGSTAKHVLLMYLMQFKVSACEMRAWGVEGTTCFPLVRLNLNRNRHGRVGSEVSTDLRL